MPAHVMPPTPYPDVNAVLNLLLSSVQTVLGDHFVGLYLYGSLASGDFDPQRSDIDFVVVTAGELPDDMIAALETMHTRIWASGLKWAAKLEGSYLPQATLRRYDSTAAPCPQINERRFYVASRRRHPAGVVVTDAPGSQMAAPHRVSGVRHPYYVPRALHARTRHRRLETSRSAVGAARTG